VQIDRVGLRATAELAPGAERSPAGVCGICLPAKARLPRYKNIRADGFVHQPRAPGFNIAQLRAAGQPTLLSAVFGCRARGLVMELRCTKMLFRGKRSMTTCQRQSPSAALHPTRARVSIPSAGPGGRECQRRARIAAHSTADGRPRIIVEAHAASPSPRRAPRGRLHARRASIRVSHAARFACVRQFHPLRRPGERHAAPEGRQRNASPVKSLLASSRRVREHRAAFASRLRSASSVEPISSDDHAVKDDDVSTPEKIQS